jgi:polysaccharide pyruvyl transferase WcaK-like protein
MTKKPVVGVFGHYGNRNLGDEAIVTATIQQLRRRLDGVEVVCFSLRPNDTASRHGVETFSVRYLPQAPVPVLPTDNFARQDLPWNATAGADATAGERQPPRTTLKQRVKALPIVGRLATLAAGMLSKAVGAAHEIGFICRSAAYLRRFDLLIVAGSNQFLDNFDGTWGFPYALLKWSLLAKLTGTKIAFVSVGAGPLEGRLSRLFIRLALRLSNYVSYRDTASKCLVESGRPQVDGHVYPDLAFGLSYLARAKTPLAARDKPVVAINPMPVYDRRYWFEHDDIRYHAYLEKLAVLAARLIERGYPIFLFPTMWRDDDVIRDVLEKVRSGHGLAADAEHYVKPSQQVSELVDALQSADIVVATRFHAVVLPYHLGVPVLGIGYFRKTSDLMDQMGQSQYHESLDNLDVDRLWDKFLALEANWVDEQETIARKAFEYHRQVDEQWDKVVALIDASKGGR